MAGELIDQYKPSDWYRELSVGYDERNFVVIVPTAAANPQTTGGNLRGVTFNKFLQTTALGYTYPAQEYYNVISLLPSSITYTTGLTLKFNMVDDGTSAADLGLVVQMGVTIFNLSAGTFNVNLSAAGGAEQTANVTLSATSGVPVNGSIAIVNAQLGGAVANSTVVVRLRRVGTAAADTCTGRVVMLNAHLNNT